MESNPAPPSSVIQVVVAGSSNHNQTVEANLAENFEFHFANPGRLLILSGFKSTLRLIKCDFVVAGSGQDSHPTNRELELAGLKNRLAIQQELSRRRERKMNRIVCSIAFDD
jgi:hypothetical protein